MCDDSFVSEKLRELVLDENKIVTYKYLSKICSIHVNFAKRALEQFLESESTVNATYFLSGFIKQENDPKNDSYLVAVVPGEKVDKAKCTFSKIDSCHVYSIQKTKIKDSGMLYTASNEDLNISGKERCKPVIVNVNLSKSGSTPRVVKPTAPSQPSKPSPQVPKKSISSTNDSPKDKEPEVESVKSVDKPSDTKSSAKGKGNQKSKAGIMAAFARGEATKKKSPTLVSKEESKTSKPVVKKESITNGTKVSEKSDTASEKKKKNHVESSKKHKRIEKRMWSSSESSSEEEENDTPPKRSKTLNRIKQLPESDSDNEKEIKKESPSEEPISNGDHTFSDDENIIPPTPDEDKTTRQYVTVTNTYTDESGFLVTRKERQLEEVVVQESSPVSTKQSVPESPLPSKQSVKRTSSDGNNAATANKKSGKSKSVQDGKKQASLMSFFSKK